MLLSPVVFLNERFTPVGRVVVAGSVVIERTNTGGRVVDAGCVVKERLTPVAVFSVAGGVATERANRWPCCRAGGVA